MSNIKNLLLTWLKAQSDFRVLPWLIAAFTLQTILAYFLDKKEN